MAFVIGRNGQRSYSNTATGAAKRARDSMTARKKQDAARAAAAKAAAERAAALSRTTAARKSGGVNLQQRPSYNSPSVGFKPKPSTMGKANSSNPRSPLQAEGPSRLSAAQAAFAAKYRRARQYEKQAAAAKTRGSAIPRTGSAPAPVGSAPRQAAGSNTGQRKGPDGVMRTPARQAEMDAWNRKVQQSEEIKKRQTQAAQLRAYMAKASTAVQAELLPALNELTRQITSLQQRGAKAANETSQFGARAESDLTELFGRLGNFTNQVQATNNTAYEGLKSGTSANYDQLRAALGQNFDGAQAAAEAENARLGLTGTAQAPIQGMERDQQFLQGLASTDEQAMLSGLGASQQGFNQLMGMASQSAAAEGASQIGGVRRNTQKSLSDIMFEMNQGITDVEGQRGDIEMTRGEKIRQLAEALADKDYNRNMEQQQMSFEQRLAQARFNLDKQQVQASLQPQEASYEDQLRVAKLEQDLAYEAARIQKAQADAEAARAQTVARQRFPLIYTNGGRIGGLLK